jgi:hypothetical protein
MFIVNIFDKYHKLSFETIFVVVGSFGGGLLAKKWSKVDCNGAEDS